MAPLFFSQILQAVFKFFFAEIQLDIQVDVRLLVNDGRAEFIELNIHVVAQFVAHGLLDKSRHNSSCPFLDLSKEELDKLLKSIGL